MSARCLSLLSSVMSNIDEVKDKLNDGEYLALCNLLKSLNDEIKKPSREEPEEQEEQEREFLGVSNPRDDQTRSLSDRVYFFLGNPDFYTRDGEEAPRISFNEVLELFKEFLLNIHEEEEEDENLNRWFTCACGCSVAFRDIPEHLESETHKENFSIEV
jgi:hypothetical protein